jgi:hypothetical protein
MTGTATFRGVPMRKALAAPAVAIAAAAFPLFAMTAAAADTGQTYQTQLQALNGSGASGTLMIQVNGNQATVTEHVKGLAATFNGNPYPHVQHIHGDAQGVCPGKDADKNGDQVISTTEGAPSYGKILTTLSTTGDTSPAAGTTLEVAPSGGAFDYSRTFQLDQATMNSLKGGKAVIVVHGLDPAKLSPQAQGEKSDLVPSLPLAATSPALCGTLTASQMSTVPSGSAATGGGSTAGVEDAGLLAAGAALVGAGAVAGAVAYRRRPAEH